MSYDAGDFPRNLYLETSVSCNARCITCPSQYLSRPDMSLETALDLLAQCEGRRVDELHPFQYADPLVWPHLLPFLRAVRQVLPDTRIVIYTNAALLTPEIAAALIELPVHSITFSIDGATRATYEVHRRGLDFGVVVANALLFLHENERRGRPVRTRAHFTFTRLNEAERGAFARFWTGKVDEVTFHECDSRLERLLVGDRFGERRYYTQAKPAEPCAQPFNGLFVLSNGDVGMCCLDYEPARSLGNVREQRIADIWTGPVARAIRALHNAGRKAEMDICRNCSVNN